MNHHQHRQNYNDRQLGAQKRALTSTKAKRVLRLKARGTPMSPSSVRPSRASGPMASEGNAARNGRHHSLARSVGSCSHARHLPPVLSQNGKGNATTTAIIGTDARTQTHNMIVHVFVSTDRFPIPRNFWGNGPKTELSENKIKAENSTAWN